MSRLKERALNAYYSATIPGRRWAAIKRAARQTEPVRILFYHRVADDFQNDWTMTTGQFTRQVQWLRDYFDIVSLAVAQQRIAAGQNRVPTACITFDDGYADNMRHAVKLLLECHIPFTYFVSTNHVLRGEVFPHDVAAGQPLAVNSLEDLRQLADAGVEIGAHTRSHVDVGTVSSVTRLADEIVGCKCELERAISHQVRYFAFPYGQHANLSATAFRIARAAGYAGVCSAYGGYNFPGDDAFHLRRIHADPEFIRFKNWLTVDPRKVRAHRDFDPGDSEPQPSSDEQPDKQSTGVVPASPCFRASLSPCRHPRQAQQGL